MGVKAVLKNILSRPQRLSVKVTLLFSLLLGGSILTFIVHGIFEQAQNRGDSLRQQAQVLARNLAATSAGYLLSRDYTSIEFSLLRSARFPGIKGIQVCDTKGHLLGDVVHVVGAEPQARYEKKVLIPPVQQTETVIVTDDTLIVWQPVVLGEPLGWIKVRYDLKQISDEIARVWGRGAIVGLLTLIVSAILLIVFTRRSIAAIRSYTEFADRLDECKGDEAGVVDSSLELNTLGLALNRVSNRLKEQSIVIANAMADMQRMAAAAEHAPNIILSINDNCDFGYINPYGHRMLLELGINEDQLKSILPHNLATVVESVLQQQSPVRELEVVCHGRTLQWTIAPVHAQKMVHAYGVDVTERKQAEEDARIALIEKLGAEAANKSKSQFLAKMSHELRTPLNAIIGYSELLNEEVINAANESYSVDLTKIQMAGKHLLTLINEILDISKIEAGRMEMYLEQINLEDFVDDVIATTQPLIEKNGNHLIIKRATDLGEARSDVTKLRQILFNLISNASKFTKHGDVTISVYRHEENDTEWITFSIQDSGIGMTAEQLERVFEPFSQADNSTTRKYGGTGLGLAITRNFCSMLGGEIKVDSTPNVGSTFTVRLPTVTRDPETEWQRKQEDSSHLQRRKIVPDSNMERRRKISEILVIDDDTVTREMVKQYLLDAGYKVWTAANGHEGLLLAKEIRPDIITLDVMMPGVDGWEVLKAIKNDSETAHIPVVMLSSVDETELGFSLGASDYLQKPVKWGELDFVIKKWLRKVVLDNILLLMKQSRLQEAISNHLEAQHCLVSLTETHFYATQSAKKIVPTLIVVDLSSDENDARQFIRDINAGKTLQKIDLVVLVTSEQIDRDKELLSLATHKLVIDGDNDRIANEIFTIITQQRKSRQAA